VIPSGPPRALLVDVGLTLVHPNGRTMLGELRRDLPLTALTPEDMVATLVLAAEARHLPYPAGDGDARVIATWGMLLGLSGDAARRLWGRTIARPGLYDGLDPDAVALLAGLRARGLLVAAVSNSDGSLEAELDRFGLLGSVDVVVDSTAIGLEKPEPGIYAAACAALSLSPAECWFLGDGLVNDVIAPEGAGVARGVLYDRFGLYGHLAGVARVACLGEVLGLVDHAAGTPEEPPRRLGGCADAGR
jgi:FMN phosphatase YigB (HAD superfamily)